MTYAICSLWWCSERTPRGRLGRCDRHRCRSGSASYWLVHDYVRDYGLEKWRSLCRAVFERDEYVCAYCGGVADTVDHIIPATAGGTNDPSNLCACCLDCNATKADHN